jgi:hypothetical protein
MRRETGDSFIITTIRNVIYISTISSDGVAVSAGSTVWRSNPSGGEIFCTRPDRPWGPSNLLHNGYRVCAPRVRRPGRGVNHPHPIQCRGYRKSRSIPLIPLLRPSWPVMGRCILILVYVYHLLVKHSHRLFTCDCPLKHTLILINRQSVFNFQHPPTRPVFHPVRSAYWMNYV